jgi:hypothetical protein
VASFARPLSKQTNAFFANFAERVRCQLLSLRPTAFVSARRAHQPSSAGRRSRFGATGLNQRDEFVAVMFELLVADAGDAAELL